MLTLKKVLKAMAPMVFAFGSLHVAHDMFNIPFLQPDLIIGAIFIGASFLIDAISS